MQSRVSVIHPFLMEDLKHLGGPYGWFVRGDKKKNLVWPYAGLGLLVVGIWVMRQILQI